MRRFLLLSFSILLATFSSYAQFSDLGFGGTGGLSSQQTNDGTDTASVTKQFDVKQYFRALGHKDTIKISWMFGASIVLPGTAQIYNRDYWKLPIIYGGIGGMVAGGLVYHSRYIKTDIDKFNDYSTYFYIGAGLFYWASLMDGVASFKAVQNPLPGRATLYSALLPGLGQMYNGDYWHIPIWYAGLAVAGYCWNYNGKQYIRYRDLYNLATTDGGSGYSGSQTADNLKYYRDKFRRFRDYSILATAVVYLLQIIDANVFATMSDFDVTDDLSMDVSPAIITPLPTINNNYNFTSVRNSTSLGLQLNFTF